MLFLAESVVYNKSVFRQFLKIYKVLRPKATRKFFHDTKLILWLLLSPIAHFLLLR